MGFFKYESSPQMSIYLLIHTGLLIINVYHETKGKTLYQHSKCLSFGGLQYHKADIIFIEQTVI